MKKIIALLLVLTMVFAFAACAAKTETPATETSTTEETKTEETKTEETKTEETPAAETTDEVKTYKVGVAIYQFDDNFMTLFRNELKSYMESLQTDTVKYDITIVDGKNDMATQTEQINSFITQGVDLIICNLVQTSSADTIVNKVVDADIPLVLNNPYVCYVGADARQSGTYQGEIVAALPDKGDANGDGVVSYVMIEGDPENIDAQYRTEFSIKALEDAGITVECLDDQVGNWATDKGQQIAANALSAHGDKIDVIFCNNDGMALGAAAAITAAGRTVGKDIYLLGVDALEECQEMVKNGTMTGTVRNDHVGQSHNAVDVAIQALNGEAIDNYYWVDCGKVDASYVGESRNPSGCCKCNTPVSFRNLLNGGIIGYV